MKTPQQLFIEYCKQQCQETTEILDLLAVKGSFSSLRGKKRQNWVKQLSEKKKDFQQALVDFSK